MTETTETLLIQNVRDNKDSESLLKLVRKYSPMILNMKSQYYVQGYDNYDWFQDALLVCYQTCQVFDGNSGSKFGSFFKLKFKNHIIDCIRRENAFKRKANINTKPLGETSMEDRQDRGAVSNCGHIILENGLQDIVQDFTDLELTAFQFFIGKITKKEACEQANCDIQKINSASYRISNKFKQIKTPLILS